MSVWLAGSAAAAPDGPVESDPPAAPSWTFEAEDRPVKVLVLAGSIGAFPGNSYARWLRRMCRNVEIRNLSKVGAGAWGLKQQFRQQVIENPELDLDEHAEVWMLFGGGLNSVSTPRRTNRWMRELFMLAHDQGLRVAALSLTPWGAEDDPRWQGASAVRYRRWTTTVVDFIMGRLSPTAALGGYARRRVSGPWRAAERPDVAIDLYDSPLRDVDAEVRDEDAMREALLEDGRWRRAHADDAPRVRARALQRDAELAARAPRWYLRPELQSFDHVHLNAEGHRLIAEVACPGLPDSWGCRCPSSNGGRGHRQKP